MTLTEIDNLKENDPERFYEYYLFEIERKKAEIRKLEEIKEGRSSGQGDPEVIKLMEELPTDFVSDIGERLPDNFGEDKDV